MHWLEKPVSTSSRIPSLTLAKKSKKGKLTLQRLLNGTWVTVTEGQGAPDRDHLVEVYRDGKLLVERKFKTIRERSELGVHAQSA